MRRTLFSITVSASMLASCGGGGSTVDGLEPISVTPSTLDVTSKNGCAGQGSIVTVYISGGTPPYFVRNPIPDAIAIAPSVVGSPGGTFVVSLKGGCFTTIPLNVVDSVGKNTNFSLSYTSTN
jgi:hypothetical protein